MTFLHAIISSMKFCSRSVLSINRKLIFLAFGRPSRVKILRKSGCFEEKIQTYPKLPYLGFGRPLTGLPDGNIVTESQAL